MRGGAAAANARCRVNAPAPVGSGCGRRIVRTGRSIGELGRDCGLSSPWSSPWESTRSTFASPACPPQTSSAASCPAGTMACEGPARRKSQVAKANAPWTNSTMPREQIASTRNDRRDRMKTTLAPGRGTPLTQIKRASDRQTPGSSRPRVARLCARLAPCAVGEDMGRTWHAPWSSASAYALPIHGLQRLEKLMDEYVGGISTS